MIKLNRTTEYGLVALRHMSRKQTTDPAGVTSAREVSDTYGFPFEITAKTLQRMRDSGIIQSAQGARGGYTLSKSLSGVSLADFLRAMEGQQALVACCVPEGPSDCEYHNRCEVKGMMTRLNSKVYQFLSGICLEELAESPAACGALEDLAKEDLRIGV